MAKSDYIKREDALEQFDYYDLGEYLTTQIRGMLMDIPSADVAPVVRCKDCRYYQDNNGGYPNADCKWCEDETPDADDYCSNGAKMDEGE